MRSSPDNALRSAALALTLIACALPAHADQEDGDAPLVEHSAISGKLEALPRKPIAQRLAVTIYQFRSAMQEVTPLAATDMFTTALIESGQFRVLERAQIDANVIREKQMNAAGQTSGSVAQTKLNGAQYIFEGTISEANAGESAKQGGINIGGLTLGGGRNKDTLAIDVRIIDAASGDVLDSVAVSKVIKSSSAGIGGTAAFASTVASMMGKSTSPLTPDVNLQTARKEGVDKALRSCIEAAVLELIKRLPAGVGTG